MLTSHILASHSILHSWFDILGWWHIYHVIPFGHHNPVSGTNVCWDIHQFLQKLRIDNQQTTTRRTCPEKSNGHTQNLHMFKNHGPAQHLFYWFLLLIEPEVQRSSKRHLEKGFEESFSRKAPGTTATAVPSQRNWWLPIVEQFWHTTRR